MQTHDAANTEQSDTEEFDYAQAKQHEKSSRENNSANQAPSGFFAALEQDIALISTSFDAIFKWCMNTSNIMALEAKTAIRALPRFLLARFAFVILQLFSWALLLLTVAYAVYTLTGTMLWALGAAILLQASASVLFFLYIQRLRSDLHFSQTRAEFKNLQKIENSSEGEQRDAENP
ncbi:hypothetical protein TDB9533_02530 [Thalassocella blandensis]|nr:hypothetical protein TDB9533_02530 [Thalassocella blandensis]